MYICGVLDCNLLCFIVKNNYFQSNLNPKEFFSCLLSCFCFTLTENIRYLLPLIPIYCWNISLLFQHVTWLSILLRCLWKPHKLEWLWQEKHGWILCCFIVFFLFLINIIIMIFVCLLICLLFFTERCGMCNTAYCNLCRPRIVALYFMSMGICKCTGRNYLYFSNVISLIWGKTVLQLPESHKQCKWEFDFYFFILYGWQNAVKHLNARYQWTSN